MAQLKAKTKSYTALDIDTLKGIEAVRMRPGMYIGSIDEDGMHHLLLEVISNAIDEAINDFGNKIIIDINSKTNQISVTDFGRGIPFGKTKEDKEALIELCTSLHSGSKFGQGSYVVSGGLHGIGLTAVNALSSFFQIESTRENKYAILQANAGLIKNFEVTPKKTQQTCSTISFIPDPTIFTNIKWNKEEVINNLKLLSYLTPNITFELNYDKKIMTFISKDGLIDLLKEKTTKLNTITGIAKSIYETSSYLIEIVFQYIDNGGEKIFAFTNNIFNKDGGTHITGFKTGLTNFINEKAKELNLLGIKDSNIAGDLIRRGLIAIVSIKMKETPIFTNQTKDKLQSPIARSAGSQAINNLVISKKDLETIIKKSLVEQKAESAAKRAREASKKIATGSRSLSMIKDLPEKLVDCNQPKGELYLVEGDSAAGSATEGRDPQTQAVLPLRGKILNTFSKELTEILENDEIKNILNTLGCGIGENFNIHNLRYDKIILLADADVDGSHINVLLATLFFIHLPELIKQGKVYRAVPPLYRIKTAKQTIYLQNDNELQKYIKKYGQPTNLTRFKGLGEQNATELWDTTLNPEKRTLIQLSTKNFKKTYKLFDILMGNDSAARKEFIMDNVEEMRE
jgi:DNA gyrase/topoisomerase IV subunit B